MKKIITNLPLLPTLAIASIMMLSQAYGQSAPSIADLVEQDAAQNAEVVPTSTTDDEEDEDNSGGNGDDRGLTATLNGETFTRGDPVTIRGTVSETDESSALYVDIRDPDGIQIGTWSVPVNNDLTFIHGFTAGQLSGMNKFGTYQITLEYFLLSGIDVRIETTDVSFEYVSGTPTTTETATTAAMVNMTVINQSIVQAMEYTGQARIATQNNDTQAVLENLNLISKELESIQGNLTLTAAESSGR